MLRREEFEPLLSGMLTVYVESNLASPLAGSVAIEVNPKDSVKEIINKFFSHLQNEYEGLAIFNKHYKRLEWDATVESQGVTDGEKLYIGHERNHSLKPFHIAVIGTATLLIAIVLFIVSTVLYSSTGGVLPFQFGLVIDAGSTHTGVYLYHWPGKKDNGTGRVHQKEFCEYEVGIAKRFDPDQIVSCVNNVTSKIPTGTSRPELFLGATAGMRLLNLTNPVEADLILKTLKYALGTSSTQVKDVEIIEGKDEALYSWITINFLANKLNPEKVLETYGALDLGGASTQFAFALQDDQSINFPDTETLMIYGNTYKVASKSFLCFGYLEAMNRFEALLFLRYKTSTIVDACIPMGLSQEFKAATLSKYPCVENKNFSAWLDSNSSIDQLVIHGSSNFTECKKYVSDVLNENICAETGFEQCMSGMNLSALNLKFVAISGFYYVINFFNATTLEQLVERSEDWCNLSWNEIQKRVPESEYQHVWNYCFAALYIIELLTTKYGFDTLSWSNLSFSKNIDDTDLDWALGFMINATNSIPDPLPSSPAISLGIFVPLVLISVLMVFAAALIIHKTFLHRRKYDRVI